MDDPISSAAQTALQATHTNPDTGEEIAHDGQQWVNATTGQPYEPKATMISPSGDVAAIPHSQSALAATKGGYKLAVHMVGKDGSEAVIPTDKAHAAMAERQVIWTIRRV